jgi:hypothetical protein
MEEGKLIKKTLWLFEYNRGDTALYIQQFYAVDEADVRRQIDEFIRTASFPVYWEGLRHLPGGFTIGYSSLRGVIYERVAAPGAEADKTLEPPDERQEGDEACQ